MNKVKRPIFIQLLLRIALPLFLIYLCVFAYTHFSNRENTISLTEDYLHQLVQLNAQKINNELQEIEKTSRTVKHYIETRFHTLNFERLIKFLEYELTADPELLGLGFGFLPYKFDPDVADMAYYMRKLDDTIIYNDLTVLYDYHLVDWFIVPVTTGQTYWTEPFFGETAGEPIVLVANPIYYNGEIVGTASAYISLTTLDKIFHSNSIPKGFTYCLTKYGAFVHHEVYDYVMKESLFSLAEFYERPDIRTLAKEITTYYQTPEYQNGQVSKMTFMTPLRTDDTRYLFHTPIPTTKWSFVAVMDEADIMVETNRIAKVHIITILIGLVVLMILIWSVASSYSRRLKILAKYTDDIAAGYLELDSESSDSINKIDDEISALNNNFHKMVYDLRRYVSTQTRLVSEKEAIESEIRIARQIQESLLPHNFPPYPERSEFDLYAVNIPAKYVAGDIYDFFLVDDDTLAIFMADVSGKGVSAGLFTAVTKSLINLIHTTESTPERVLRKVNEALCKDNHSCMFVTAFLGFINLKQDKLDYANAGHPYPLLIRENGLCLELISDRNIALGINATKQFKGNSINLEKNDLIMLFTDGVSDALNPNKEMFGVKRFKEIICQNTSLPLKEIIAKVTNELDVHQGKEVSDDVTMLAVRYFGC